MTEHEIHKRWQIFQGKRNPQPETLKVTTGGIRYEMPVYLYSKFSCWAANERRYGRPYTFDIYYETVLLKNQALINSVTLTETK